MVADKTGGGRQASASEGRTQEVARRVALRREALGLTQAELAKRAVLSVRTIRNVELGRIAQPRAATLKRIADVLQIDVGEPEPSTARSSSHAPTIPSAELGLWDGFIGRDAELVQLDALFTAHHTAAERPTVCVLVGAAGVGKTCLALQWATRKKDQFPGGQVCVNLRGLDPTGNPMGTAEAMHAVIDCLNETDGQPPPIMTNLHAGYLAALAGEPTLLILDNARDADQVRPLLPGLANCFVLITSRDDLAGLVVHQAARPLDIGRPDPDEAVRILRHRLGADRLAAEPEAINEILIRTARLPLALDVLAARATARPDLSLRSLVADMRGRHPLDALADGNDRYDVRAVFSWSYAALPPETQRAYRLMSQHPGPEASVKSAASLLGRAPEATRHLLAVLTRSHLLEERSVGRFAFHDLLRAHAMELARRHEDQSDQADAVRRVMEHFRHTAAVAYTLIHSDREPIVPGPRPAGVWLADLHDHQMAFGWFERERATIPEVIRWLARHQRHLATWQLAWCYGEYLERQGPWTEWVDVLNVALTSSRHTGNRAAEAGTLRRLGGAFAYQSELDLCLGYFQQALALYEVLGDEVGKARVHMNLAYVAERQARPADVLQHSTQALSGYRLAGDQHGQARALNAVGYSYALLGQHRQTLTHCGQALRTLEVLGLRRGLSPTLHSLGFAHHCLGEFPEAITHFEAAIRAAREIGNRAEELLALEHLSTSLESTGQQERAAQVNRAARTIRDALGRKAA